MVHATGEATWIMVLRSRRSQKKKSRKKNLRSRERERERERERVLKPDGQHKHRMIFVTLSFHMFFALAGK